MFSAETTLAYKICSIGLIALLVLPLPIMVALTLILFRRVEWKGKPIKLFKLRQRNFLAYSKAVWVDKPTTLRAVLRVTKALSLCGHQTPLWVRLQTSIDGVIWDEIKEGQFIAWRTPGVGYAWVKTEYRYIRAVAVTGSKCSLFTFSLTLVDAAQSLEEEQ